MLREEVLMTAEELRAKRKTDENWHGFKNCLECETFSALEAQRKLWKAIKDRLSMKKYLQDFEAIEKILKR